MKPSFHAYASLLDAYLSNIHINFKVIQVFKSLIFFINKVGKFIQRL